MFALTKAQQREQARIWARAELLKACGLDFDKQARLLGNAIRKLSRGLHSRKLEVVVINGEIKRVMVPDNATQIRCAEKLVDVFAGNAKQMQDVSDPVNVTIVFPDACRPPDPPREPVMLTHEAQVLDSTGHSVPPEGT